MHTHAHTYNLCVTSTDVPQKSVVFNEHVHVSLERVFVQCRSQPRPAAARVAAHVTQTSVALQLVRAQVLLDVLP